MVACRHESRRPSRHHLFRPGNRGGTPVFASTRVPLQNLIDAMEGAESIDEFLEGSPSVNRAHVIAVIEADRLKMLELV